MNNQTLIDGPRAWANAIAVGICGALSQGVLLFYCFGIFVTPIAKSLKVSPALVGAAVSPAIMIMALLFPLYGVLIDRWGVRKVVLSILIPYTLCAAAIGTVDNIKALTLMLIVTSVIGAPINPASWVPVVCQWFSKRRGLALGVSTAVTGLGVSIMPLLTAWILLSISWREAIGLMAAGFSVGVGLCLILVVRSPRESASKRGLSGAFDEVEEGVGIRDALRTPVLYILCGSFFLIGVAMGGAVVHVPAYLRTEGMPLVKVSLLVATLGISNVVSRLFVGLVFDRAYVPYISASVFVFGGAAVAIFASLPGNLTACFAASIFLGAALGAETADMGYLVSAAYGPKHNAKLFGGVLTFYSLGQGAGAGIVGIVAEKFEYRLGFAVVGCGCIIAAIAMVMIRPAHLPFYPIPLRKRGMGQDPKAA